MANPGLPPAGLSGIDAMAWIRESGRTVAFWNNAKGRLLWKEKVFETMGSESLRKTWLQYSTTRYFFRLLPTEIVIDFDGENAPDRWREMQARFKIRNTRIVRTPSGGLHVYLRRNPETPIRHGTNVMAECGFDRCDVFTNISGMITGPGSRRPETTKKRAGSYLWCTPQTELAEVTDALADALKPPPVPEVEHIEPREFDGEISTYAQRAFDGELGRVQGCGEGGRQSQLYKSAAALGALVAGGCLSEGMVKRALYNAAATNGLVKDDGAHAVKTTIKNGFKAGMKSPRRPSPRTQRNSRPPYESASRNRRADHAG